MLANQLAELWPPHDPENPNRIVKLRESFLVHSERFGYEADPGGPDANASPFECLPSCEGNPSDLGSRFQAMVALSIGGLW